MTTRTPNIGLARPDFDRRQWQDLINDNFTVLDALWAKFFATTGLAGVWQNATAYTVGVLVVDETLGSIWRCEIAHTSPSSGTFLAARTSSPTYWSNYSIGVRYKGAWASDVAYAAGDFVATGFQFAVANAAHSSSGVFSSTDGSWEILIDGGPMLSTAAAYAVSAGTYATAAGVAASAAGTYATAAGVFASAAGTYATAAALSAAMASAGVVWCGTGTGADDIVLTAASFALVDGATVEWRQVSDNTTTVRLNPNGVGLTALRDGSGTAITAAGTLKGDRLYRAKYSTTTSNFEFLGPAIPASATQSQVNAGTSTGVYIPPALEILASWFSPRNWLINPEGFIFQRTAPTTDNAYAWDRWRLLLGAANAATVSQLTSGLPTGTKNAMRLTVGSGNNNKFGIFQPIEGVDIYALRGKTVCLQAYIKATADLSDIRMAIVEWTGTEDATTGDPISAWNTMATVPTYNAGWANLNTPANLSVTTSFAQYSVTAAVGSSATNLGVFIWNEDTSTTQTTDILDITAVVFSAAGSIVNYTPRPIAEELSLCQRYCWIWASTDGVVATGFADGNTTAIVAIKFPTTMRTAPTFSVSNVTHFQVDVVAGTSGDTTGLTASLISTEAANLSPVRATSTWTAGQGVRLVFEDAAAKLIFEAEI